jgi:hypothetical protein
MFDGKELGGRSLRINEAEERQRPQRSQRSGGGYGSSRGKPPFKSKGSRRGLRGRKRSL